MNPYIIRCKPIHHSNSDRKMFKTKKLYHRKSDIVTVHLNRAIAKTLRDFGDRICNDYLLTYMCPF